MPNTAASATVADGGVTVLDVETGGISYRYEIDGTASVNFLSHVVSKSNTIGTIDDQQASGADGGEYTFEDGEKARITLTVTRSGGAADTGSDGFHDMQLTAIGWSTDNEDDTMNIYEFDLDDYKTDPIFANSY